MPTTTPATSSRRGRVPAARLGQPNGRDAAGRIAYTMLGASRGATYHYDHAGERFERLDMQSGNVLTYQMYVDAGFEADWVTNTHEVHVFVGSRRVATSRRPGLGTTTAPSTDDVQLYHTDHVGSNTVVTDAATAQVRQETFLRPFGEVHEILDAAGQPLGNPDDSVTPYLFTDQERDTETDLHYFGARYYDPWVGRFLSQDPELVNGGVTFGRIAADGQNLNPYAYVLNRPTILADPTGRIADLAIDMVDWDGRSTTYYGDASAAVANGLGTVNSSTGAMMNNNVMTCGTLGAPGGNLGGSATGPGGTGSAAGGASQSSLAAAQTTPGTSSSPSGNILQSAGDYLGRLLRGEIKTILGTIFGIPYGIGKGLYGIGAGIIGGDVGRVGAGLLDIAAAVTPRADSMTGWRWPGTRGNVGITPAAGTRLEGASAWHDNEFGAYRFGSASQFGWITRAWAGPGVLPGPYGLTLTVVGTVGFGVVGSVQAVAGF